MKSVSALPRRFSLRFSPASALALAVIFAALITAGCGGAGSSGQKLTGNTQVTVMVSSTANDQFQLLQVGFTNLALTSQRGKTVTLLSSAQSAEFLHNNGGAEPFLTVSVPQDIYTGATATNLGVQFACATFYPPDVTDYSTFGDPLGGPAATFNFPAPITITGDSMVLSLDIFVSQTITLSSCYNPQDQYTWTFAPTFNLTPLTVASPPTNSGNGKVSGLHGAIATVGDNSFTISLPVEEGPETLSISANDATAYQGIGNFSSLSVGTFVDMDGALQSDGSLLATRIAVDDTGATNVFVGPLIYVVPSVSDINVAVNQEDGAFFQNQEVFGQFAFNYGSAAFQISQQLSNLQDLPFTPSFTATNMVPGQNVYLTAPALSGQGPDPVARTITLIPQSIDATVSASSNSGSFAVYTVILAPYDLFPNLAVQPEQQTLLTNPNQVEVYVDSNTQMLNSEQLSVGNTFRFNGLIFNDNGTLRMDCAQVNDGVPE